jgi:hypothetical protein
MPNKLVIDSAMLTQLHALIKAKAEAEKRAAELPLLVSTRLTNCTVDGVP